MPGSYDVVTQESEELTEEDIQDYLAEQQYEDMKFRQKYGY